MKLKLLFIALVLIFSKHQAQKQYNYKAIYDLSYKSDSLGDYRMSQNVLLLNDNSDSYFRDYKKFKRDSTNSNELKGIATFISEIIFTNNNNKEIQINRNFTGTNLFYKENIPNNWVIANKPAVFINGIKCREATLDAYGRNGLLFIPKIILFSLDHIYLRVYQD